MTCDSAARVKKRRLNQSTCTNSDIPLWLNTRKPPARKDGPLHHPTKDKTNRILYIMCGVLAVMLVGIFTKLGLEKAHRRQRKPSPGRLPPLHPTPSPPLRRRSPSSSLSTFPWAMALPAPTPISAGGGRLGSQFRLQGQRRGAGLRTGVDLSACVYVGGGLCTTPHRLAALSHLGFKRI